MTKTTAVLTPLILAALFSLTGCASPTATPAKPTAAPAASGNAESPDIAKIIRDAAATPPAPVAGEGWKPLFNGRTLDGWRVTEFPEHGAIRCQSGMIVLNGGATLTGLTWTNAVPNVDYEIALEAMRVDGSDFFCGLTFPVKDSHCTLILGGWGGEVTGISSINGDDASDNQTTKAIEYDMARWYRVRLRVAESRIEAWFDGQKIVDLDTTGLKIAMRPGDIEMSEPLGIATWKTTGAVREIKLRKVDASSAGKK